MSVNPKTFPKTGPAMKGTAIAPFVYFDNAPTLGVINNIIEVDLASRVSVLQSDGGMSTDMICVAHLRCSIEAVLSLRAAIDKALELAKRASASAAAPKADDDYIDEDPPLAAEFGKQAMQQ